LFCTRAAAQRYALLVRRGVVCDLRRPNVIRIAPVSLYNTFDEVRRFAGILKAAQEAR
jgi:kynureninase